jgi:hypothetical protein
MPRVKHPEPVKPVPCRVCRKEVPRDEAVVPEAQDKLVYYCSLDCYDKWKAGAPQRPA